MKHNSDLFGATKVLLINMLIAYLGQWVCHIAYVTENWQTLGSELLKHNSIADLFIGSLRFDTAAVLYTNAIVLLALLLPYPNKVKRMLTVWLSVVLNGLCIILNLADSVYFRYTGRRTTTSVLQEFRNENNMDSIVATELLRHWYLVLLGAVLVYTIYKVLHTASKGYINNKQTTWQEVLVNLVVLLFCLPLCIGGMRGGFTKAVRPITISNANQYVAHPTEAAAILNTPFSLIRTIGKTSFHNPQYFTKAELDSIYSPIHNAFVKTTTKPTVKKRKNVVVLIVESFGREYIGALNRDLDKGKYKGYTPRVDSIIGNSLTFDYTFCNGRKSIDGMPSILSSIPMFVEPFFLTPASMNNVSGIAGELSKAGYHTAFFHGAENGSMGFLAFAHTTGFQRYYGRTEYNADKRFGGNNDFDGTWAIWDEPFLQYYSTKMSEMPEPFMTAVFTASSHHPFRVPEKYKTIYTDDGPNTLHKCIQYTDMAIGKFFETAKHQPWFKNTIFVITSDHTNGNDHPEYATDLGGFSSPIIIYDPLGDIKPMRRHCVAQQIDIMPTMLNYLGYSNPYIAFGKDLFTTNDNDTWAINYLNGIYQYVKGDYLLQFDGQQSKAMYRFRTDRLLRQNLINKEVNVRSKMERETKAIIQAYMQRMEENELTVR